MWNDYSPARIRFTDPEGRTWHLPRHWLTTGGTPLKEEAPYQVTQDIVWAEALHLPLDRSAACPMDIVSAMATAGDGPFGHLIVFCSDMAIGTKG